MLNLKNVTLCAVASTQIGETIEALRKSMRGISYARVLFLTHENISLEQDHIEVIKIKKLNYKEYGHFILYELKDYIDSEFVLIVQYDGYVLRPSRWDNRFFEYDYIGAPWRKNLHFLADGTNVRVGNGGFTLRSKKMLNAPSDLNLPFTDNGTGFFHEDGVLCVYHRKVLEENGIKYAPVEIASMFSRERWCSDSKFFTFGFHSNRRNLFKYAWKKLKKFLKKI